MTYDRQMIPIGEVQPGYTLVVDRGNGEQLFRVEAAEFSATQQEDGSYKQIHRLRSGPVDGGGAPWVIEGPPDIMVCRITGRPS
ncbi:hypothetical protein AWC02_00970 [Mycolicibacter engbaekii]|uniref:Uncharacterized protein n=1 Tax=Mycolicibacter engbaekii TaxID=188915 RepID=A0A1X1T472_9MYCO|nr:hypothetical protein [Mycolicibacter engbaekii]ORV39320.1 hypothetical protein AWC02_00970 [Mycolicibacter engbaekii]